MSKRLYLILVASFLSTVFIANFLFPSYPVLEKSEEQNTWIRNQKSEFVSYFRKTVVFNKKVDRAWIAVRARDGFELLVNGNTAGRFFYWRATRPFQNGLNASGQRLVHSAPALSLNYPREYQWTGHENHLHPIYYDLTPHLQPGKNVIAFKVESRGAKTALSTKGEVILSTGEIKTIDSDSSWKSTVLPRKVKNLHWSAVNYPDGNWKNAKEVLGSRMVFRQFNPEVFKHPFQAKKLNASSEAETDGFWFESEWSLESIPADAWLRVFSNRLYSAEINGELLRTSLAKPRGENQGEWLMRNQRVKDLPSQPELLDPDETGDYFGGQKFLLAPHSDPTLNNFNPFENNLNRTKDRPNSRNEEDDFVQSNSGTVSDPFAPESYRPQKLSPVSLARGTNFSSFSAYNIRNMLKTGSNRVRIRLNNTEDRTSLPFVALDAKAYSKEGTELGILSSNSDWKVYSQSVAGQIANANKALVSPVGQRELPELKYQGQSWSWGNWLPARLMIFVLTFLSLTSFGWFIGNSRKQNFELSLVIYSLLLVVFLILRTAFYERHEIAFFFQPVNWGLSLLTALVCCVVIYFRVGRKSDFLTDLYSRLFVKDGFFGLLKFKTIRAKTIWDSALWLCLVLCGVLRAYKLEFQPLDDDEYASTQAILSIASTGLPGLSEGVFYTRSPFYHYLTGIVVSIFGENIWALRLPTVLFGILTGYLIYKICRDLLNSPGVGIASLFLYSIHPFAIYSSHIARFYQQQQFFYVLTTYFFVKGFVLKANQKYAYLTLGSFLLAVLSQEISIILGVQLLLAYLVFAQRRSAANNLRLIVASISVVLLNAINILVFQAATLTSLSGVSPNIEATIAPNFSAPMNYFSLFIGYSRLHVPLSIFFIFGALFCLRKRNLAVLSLLFFTLSGVLLVNLLVTGVSLRYQYPLLPLLIILAVYGLRECSEVISEYTARCSRQLLRHGWLANSMFVLGFLAITISFSPWRIPGSYQEKILGDSSGALQFVKSQLQPGDKVAITEPHPHAALIELGQADYDLAIPLLYDFTYVKDGVLVDRNAGAKVISNISMLQDAVSEHQRLWVLVNREKFRSRGKNIRWEYPGARAELFLRENFEVKYETYLWTVFLWDVSEGEFTPFNRLS